MSITTGLEKAKSRESLTCLLQALVGRSTVVELRGEVSLRGLLSHVDAMGNVEMRDARRFLPDGRWEDLERILVSATSVRFVHIPADVDVMAAMRRSTSSLTAPRAKQPTRLTTKQKRDLAFERQRERMREAMQRHKENRSA